MAAVPARFTFDLDLGRREERGRMLTDYVLADMLKTARTEGFAEGYSEAERGLAAAAARHLADSAENLADRAGAMVAALDEARRVAATDAAELALSVGRKLALHLIARQPAAELEALVAECLVSLERVPHVVIRCHPGIADAIRASAEARMSVTGFTGRLVVIGDPEQALSDGRIEWADGGLTRNLAAVAAEIDRAITTFLNRGASRAEEASQ